jgi:hypothetical protein
MRSNTIILLVVNLLIFSVGVGAIVYKNHQVQPQEQPIERPVDRPPEADRTPIQPPPIQPPAKNNITKAQPSYMNYDATVAQLKQWNQEAPQMTEVGTYGKTSRGKDCYYIRICTKMGDSVATKPRVLTTACIHGNEPLASSTVMWYIGALLDKYGKDEAITQLLDSRDLYFVPVVSPDSYPSSRHVDGVDPNRDFPGPSRPNHQSKAPVKAIQDLFNKIKPNAVISGHTWGRVYLTPHGDKMQNCPDHAAIMAVMNRVKELSGYRCIRACDMYEANGGLNNPPIRTMGLGDKEYNVPIHGSEVDWYYRGGAFAIVCEFGTHQRIPSDGDTRTEFDKTFTAFLLFIREAPLVAVHPS